MGSVYRGDGENNKNGIEVERRKSMYTKIVDILRTVKDDQEGKLIIHEDTNIMDDIGLDSLEMINFILAIEETFDIDIDFDDFDYDYLNSVKALCDYIEKLVG